MQKTIGHTPEESSAPDWPSVPQAPAGAPNILLVLTDDVGYGATSTFGGPVPTPTFDRIAERGLRYSAFHTTAMCSPTRAALLTGRNHHAVGTGRITESAMAYDGYTSIIPDSAATIAEVLCRSGYSTALIGKCHNVPDWESGPSGPFDHWPTGLGFQHFYGFLGGGTNQWAPALFEGTRAVEPPRDQPDYMLEHDLADRAITWIRQQKSAAPDKPFFMHYATAAGHSPHHAPEDWIARFAGRFDAGWDVIREQTLDRQKAAGVVPPNTRLTERPDEIPAWDSLSADEKRLYARMMEVFAAFLAYSDAQIGRVLDALDEMGELDNTMVVFIQGDNGASPEGGLHGELNEAFFMNGMSADVETLLAHIDELGGPLHSNHYPAGWAHAMDTPFQWFKTVASHFGGTRNGMAVSWPAGITDHNGIRNQFHHVIDIVPTLLEVIGIEAPTVVDGVEQQPIAGISMAYTFDDPLAPPRRRTQYFDLHGNRAIYHDGWVACIGPYEMPWAFKMPAPEISDREWELYHVADDYSQSTDVAADHPERLRALQDLFLIEATRNNALPILVGTARRHGPAKPSAVRGRSSFTYYPGSVRIPPGSSPDVVGRGFTVRADVELPHGAEGFIFGQGGRFGGHALYLRGGRLVYHYNLLGAMRYEVVSEQPIPAGRHDVGVTFAPEGATPGSGGLVTLELDGTAIGSGPVDATVPWTMSYVEGLNIGLDTGTPVSEDYRVPFALTGTLYRAEVDLV